MRTRPLRLLPLLLLAGALIASCSNGDRQVAATASSTTSATPTTTLDAKALPLGDGKVSSSPRIGDVTSCRTTFGAGGGAFADGPWISGTTWDPDTKVHVQGDVAWPEASYHVQVSGETRVITTADLPVGHGSGTFPVGTTDPAYQYDRNPNRIAAKSLTIDLPAVPVAAATPSCLDLGAIGVLSDGVLLFDALDAEGRDAAAHEVLDACDGHPERSGEYHHHTVPACLAGSASAPSSSTLVGYALDGFGIYVERDAGGRLPTDADLDECHGRTSEVDWDGQQVRMYHYDATLEYPYTVGCYRGTAVRMAAG